MLSAYLRFSVLITQYKEKSNFLIVDMHPKIPDISFNSWWRVKKPYIGLGVDCVMHVMWVICVYLFLLSSLAM